MIGWVMLGAVTGAYVGFLVHRRRRYADEAWRELQRERGRYRADYPEYRAELNRAVGMRGWGDPSPRHGPVIGIGGGPSRPVADERTEDADNPAEGGS